MDAVAWVATTEGWPAAGIFSVNKEVIAYTALTESTFTGLTRGFDNTSPASHLAQTRVDLRITAKHLNDAAFANPAATEDKVGGIPVGSTFPVKTTVQEMFDRLLYPYRPPEVEDFWVMGGASPYHQVGVGDPAGRLFAIELGDNLPGSLDFWFTVYEPGNVAPASPGSYTIYQDYPAYGEPIGVGSSAPIHYEASPGAGFDTPTPVTFRIVFTDVEGVQREETMIMLWTTRCQTGSLIEGDPNAIVIDDLNSFLTAAENQLVNTWAWEDPGYKWFVIGELDGSPSPAQASGWINEIRETENNFLVPMADFSDNVAFSNEDPQGYFFCRRLYTNPLGVTYNVRIYRTKNSYNAPLAMAVT